MKMIGDGGSAGRWTKKKGTKRKLVEGWGG